MEGKIYITLVGKRKMEEEVRRLKGKERPKVISEVEVAREHGDLSENAEYHAAKERLGHINGKIADIEDKLTRAVVVDISKIDTSKVVFGTIVTIVNLDNMKESSYRIVGDYEANLDNNEISINSPIARALIGKHVGDEVSVSTPSGKKDFEIIDINK